MLQIFQAIYLSQDKQYIIKCYTRSVGIHIRHSEFVSHLEYLNSLVNFLDTCNNATRFKWL